MPSFVRLSCAALLLAGAAAGAQTEKRTIAGERVAIYNLVGKLRVEPTTGSQVTVDITRGGRDANQLKVEQGDIRGWQALRVIYPADRIIYPDMPGWGRTTMNVNADGTFGDHTNERGWFSRNGHVEIRNSGSGLEAFADLRVGVPKGQRIAVNLGVGEATVSNVDGDIIVSVSASRLTTEHTRGRLTLDTGSGGLSVTDAQGDINLDTGSGGVTVTGIKGPTLKIDAGSGSVQGSDIDVQDLKADVGSGGMRLDRVRAPRINLDVGSGGMDLELLADVEELKIDAGSGGVTIKVPSTLGAEVEIETGSGGIDSELPLTMTRVQRNYIKGRLGDGRGRVRIETGSGRVRLIKGA